MQYINPELREIMRSKLKAGEHRKPVIRVEIDKMTYSPTVTTEIDVSKFLTDTNLPSINDGASNPTAGATIGSPIKGYSSAQLLSNHLSSPFGLRKLPTEPAARQHNGVDFGNGLGGKEIIAAADGIVVLAGPYGGAGNAVGILHANGIRTNYYHMVNGSIKVSVGDQVAKGQVLGIVGNTGNSYGSHLHFEVRTGATKTNVGTAVNPVPYLKDEASIAAVNTVAATGSGTVNANGVRFRLKPNTGSEVIRELSSGTPLTIQGITGEWYKVEIGGSVGYISKQYVSTSTQSENKEYAIVNTGGVGLRVSASLGAEVKTIVGIGTLLMVVSITGSWAAVDWQGATLYVESQYLTVNNKPITTKFTSRKVDVDGFESYSINSQPSKYLQDITKLWKVTTDGNSNVFQCKGGAVGKSWIKRATPRLANPGRVEVKFKTNFSGSVSLNIYVNNKKVGTYTGVSEYRAVSASLAPGVSEIKIERVKAEASLEDTVIVDSIGIYEQIYSAPAEVTVTDIQPVDKAMVVADGASILSGQGTGSVVAEAEVGDSFDVIDDVGNYYKVSTIYGEGYVRKDVVERMTDVVRERLVVRSGGYVFDRTIRMESEVVSVETDFQYEMRAGEATVTLRNYLGRLSPDYRPSALFSNGASPYVDYVNGEPDGMFSDNTPIRIYMGYGQHVVRVFTGLIDDVDIDGPGGTLTIKCSSMMKKLNNYVTLTELRYPPEDTLAGVAWLTSSVMHDLALKAGMTNWRIASDDRYYPDIEVTETYYTDINPVSGLYVKIQEDGAVVAESIASVPTSEGWRNPHAVINKTIPVGASLGEELDTMCQGVNYWLRDDRYGTIKMTPAEYGTEVVARFSDNDNILTLSKSFAGSRIRNHLIVVGGGQEDHFFDTSMFKMTKGERRTAKIAAPWADDYGKRKAVADKAFKDIKTGANTLQCSIEGNPYLDLLDLIEIEDKRSSTKNKYHIKGIRHSYQENAGLLTMLDASYGGA